MKTITYITLLIIAMYANPYPRKVNLQVAIQSEPIESEFQKLCKTLPKVNLPYSVYCVDCCSQPKLTDRQSDIIAYLPEGSTFVGVIESNNNYISLLVTYPADWIIPAVIVLTKDGNLIDEKVFLGGYCGNDYGYIGKQYFFISENIELLEIDTAYYVRYNEETYDIIDTTKIEIQNKKFSIGKNGKINAI
jgi:hypothetical protein